MTFALISFAKKLHFSSFLKIFFLKIDEYFNHFTFINYPIDLEA